MAREVRRKKESSAKKRLVRAAATAIAVLVCGHSAAWASVSQRMPSVGNLPPVPVVLRNVGPVAPARVVHRATTIQPWLHDPALHVLNPWYLRIATAVVTNNTVDLDKYAVRMQKFAADKTKPYLWFPATRARTFCLVWLDDETAFIHSFAMLCHARGVRQNQDKVIIFAQRIFAVLAKQKRAAWVRAAVAQGLPASGPGPGKLYMYLLNQRLGQMRSPIAKRNLIQLSIGHAVIALENAKKILQPAKGPRNKNHPGPLVLGYPQSYYRYQRNLETLRYMAVINDTQGLSTVELCRDGQSYLAIYGAKGRYSANVFYATLNQLYLVHRVLPQPVQKQRILAQGAWLDDWYAKVTAKPSPLVKQIQARWQEWQALR